MQIKSQHYQVAYRKGASVSEEIPLAERKKEPFILIPNTLRYWAADPFLYEQEGKVWLFCELYDFVKRKGVIACALYENGIFSKWKKVLEEPFHLSYPLVFSNHGEIYMLPETCHANEVVLYKATKFPYEWKRHKVLLQGEAFVDTTIIKMKNGFIGLSVSGKNVWLLELDDSFELLSQTCLLDADFQTSRNAGNMMHINGSIIRPCQDCTVEYGRSIIFKELNVETKKETNRYALNLEDLCVCNERGKRVPIYGCHTYNRVEGLEIIDIKQKKSVHPTELFWRLIEMCGRALKK